MGHLSMWEQWDSNCHDVCLGQYYVLFVAIVLHSIVLATCCPWRCMAMLRYPGGDNPRPTPCGARAPYLIGVRVTIKDAGASLTRMQISSCSTFISACILRLDLCLASGSIWSDELLLTGVWHGQLVCFHLHLVQ